MPCPCRTRPNGRASTARISWVHRYGERSRTRWTSGAPAGSGRRRRSSVPRCRVPLPLRRLRRGPWPSGLRPRCASFIGSWSSPTCTGKRLPGPRASRPQRAEGRTPCPNGGRMPEFLGGQRFRRDPRQSAVGHREARLQGVLLEYRPALPLLWQAGGAPEAEGLFRRRRRGARLAPLQRPIPRPVELHEPCREPVRRPRRERQESGSLCRRTRKQEP